MDVAEDMEPGTDAPKPVQQFETADMPGRLAFPGWGQIPVTVGWWRCGIDPIQAAKSRNSASRPRPQKSPAWIRRSPSGTACSKEVCIPWVSLIATMERLRVGMAVI